jgi:hypothetical protein
METQQLLTQTIPHTYQLFLVTFIALRCSTEQRLMQMVQLEAFPSALDVCVELMVLFQEQTLELVEMVVQGNTMRTGNRVLL